MQDVLVPHLIRHVIEFAILDEVTMTSRSRGAGFPAHSSVRHQTPSQLIRAASHFEIAAAGNVRGLTANSPAFISNELHMVAEGEFLGKL